MTLERFEQIWTALVDNRAPASAAAQDIPVLNNGFSEKTIDALVAEAEGDHSVYEGIEQKLAATARA